MGVRPVDDVREKMGMARNAEPLADIGRVASVAKIAIGKDAFRRIDGAPASGRQPTTSPVTALGAMMGGLVLSGDLLKDVPPNQLLT